MPTLPFQAAMTARKQLLSSYGKCISGIIALMKACRLKFIHLDYDILDPRCYNVGNLSGDLERAPGWEFKVDAVSQKDGVIYLETYPAKGCGCAPDVEGITENVLYSFPLPEVAGTHNGPGEILEALEVLVPALQENPNLGVKPRDFGEI